MLTIRLAPSPWKSCLFRSADQPRWRRRRRVGDLREDERADSGIEAGIANAEDGISLIQTAEGALNETHSILQRMRELVVQSASDTNTKVDRGEIQKEIDQLAQELTRIADTTEFNTQNLLDGKLNVVFHVGANKGQTIGLAINPMGAKALGVEGVAYTATQRALPII